MRTFIRPPRSLNITGYFAPENFPSSQPFHPIEVKSDETANITEKPLAGDISSSGVVLLSPSKSDNSLSERFTNTLLPDSFSSLFATSQPFINEKAISTHLKEGITPQAGTVVPIVISNSEVLMKPSVVDAEHLNQDSRSADGSNTAAKMKLADGDVRLVNLEGTNAMKPSVVDATHLNQDQKTADGSSTADKMKHVDENMHDSAPALPPIIVSPLPHNETFPKPSNGMANSSLVSIAASFVPFLNNTSVTLPISIQTSPPINEPKLRSNDSYKLTSSYNTRWDRRAPRRWQNEYTRQLYMKSVQYVYVSVGLLTIIAWFILLPLTGVISYIRPFLECFIIRTPTPLPQIRGQSNQVAFFGTQINSDKSGK